MVGAKGKTAKPASTAKKKTAKKPKKAKTLLKY